MSGYVWAACTDAAVLPLEVWALFSAPEEAERFIAGSIWAIKSEPIAVYSRYEDCPPDYRLTVAPGEDPMSLALRWRQRRTQEMRDMASRGKLEAAGDAQVYAVCSDNSGLGGLNEVYVLYETAAEAQRYVDAAYWMFQIFELPLWASYDDVPGPQRLSTVRDRPPSQAVRLRGRRAPVTDRLDEL